MFLKSVKFKQIDNHDNIWKIKELTFDKINLIVGKNSTGKTRALNIINGLSSLVSGKINLPHADESFEFEFKKNKTEVAYSLRYKNNKVMEEKFIDGGRELLVRGKDGNGKIHFKKVGTDYEFNVPDNKLAVVNKMDKIQHPFLEKLFNWGEATRHYAFAGELGKGRFVLLVDKSKEQEPNVRDPNEVVQIFRAALIKGGDEFKRTILEQINKLGYDILDIELREPEDLIIQHSSLPSSLLGLSIKEKGHDHWVSQREMSQGLFRALSLLIQLKYSKLFKAPNLILIDDIGEGLDFDRSSKLIEILIDQAENSEVQLVMTTNDRYVMNNVPLKYFNVIQREGGECRSYNYRTSKKIFDKFKKTGLNNFDFLSSEYYKRGDE